MKKHTIILTLILLILLPTALADYTSPNDNLGVLGSGIFNSALDTTDVTTSFRSVTIPALLPLIADLNNDSIEEIVIIDGDNVEIYRGSSLTVVTGEQAEDTIDHVIIYDIDNDDFNEIITTGGDKVTIFNLNGTDDLVLTINFTIPDVLNSEFMIGCSGTNDCLIVNARFESGAPSNQGIYGLRMNSSGVYNSTELKGNTNNGDWFLPKIREVLIDDWDNDGNLEYVFTAYGYGNSDLYLFCVDTNALTGVTNENEWGVTAAQVYLEPGRDDFTSPSIYNYDPTKSGNEIAIAYQADSVNEFEMLLKQYDGTEIDDYPELTFTDGVIISNIIRANAFTDTGKEDFCVLGYDTAADEIILLCASERSGDFLDSYEFAYDGAIYYDLLDNETLYSNIIHSVEMEIETTDGTDLDEILTPMGVFSIDYEGTNELILEYEMLQVQGAALAYDLEGVDRADILYLNGDGLYYFNDGFVNENVVITEYQKHASPICWDNTFPVFVDLTDTDLDGGRCVLVESYQNGTEIAVAYNTSFTTPADNLGLYYYADSVGTFLMSIKCRDSEHVAYDTEEFVWVVSNNTGICNDPTDPLETIAPISEEDAEEIAADEAMVEDVEDFFCNSLSICGPLSRNLVALLIVALIAGVAFMKLKNMELAIGAGVIGALFSFILGLMSILPLVLIIIVGAALIVKSVLKPGG